MTFKDLGLAAPILKALEREGYTNPTPIQSQAIQPVLQGADILGIAQTGTGKTAAFALPILTKLAQDPKPAMLKGCRALVLSPTRELASQIAESFRTYGRYLDVKVAVVFGGVDIRKQIRNLAGGVDVLVATPGRLLDHVGERTVDLSGTEIFVLDEADQMLDMGFVKPIRQIASKLSRKRQNLFFSATMPKEIAGLADELLNDKPVKVSVTPVSKTADRVEQKIIHIEARKKRALLVELFGNQAMERTLVFTRTKRGADRVARHLETNGIAASAIHGNKSQRQREKALDAFKRSNIKVLVATDIAARGIDIDGVSHVVNFELPEVPEAYVHRIGRTARAGASGEAISFCDVEERDLLRNIERITKQKIPSEDRRGDDNLEAQPLPQHARDRDGARNGERPQHSRPRNNRDRNGERSSVGRKPGQSSNGGKRFAKGPAELAAASENRKPAGEGRERQRRERIADGDRRGAPERTGERGHRAAEPRGNNRGDRTERGANSGSRAGKPHRNGADGAKSAQWRKGPRRGAETGGDSRPEGGRDRRHASNRQNGEPASGERCNRNHRSSNDRGNGKNPPARRPVTFGAEV